MFGLATAYEGMTPKQQLLVTAGLLFFFFGLHNLLQEAIMAFKGFTFGLMLGYLEVLGVTIFTHVERVYYSHETSKKRETPLKAYAFLTFLLMSSSSLSNMSLNYINYPTKVVFRSCKLLPTMFIATIVNRQVFGWVQYAAAGAICLGLVLYAAADWSLAPSFRPLGLVLVLMSICADSVLPNAQEKLFAGGTSRSEVTYYTNVSVLIAMTFSTLVSGDLVNTFRFAYENLYAASYLALYTVVSYIAITVHMNAISKFGGVTTVLLGTGRKAMTIMLSFIVFPKQFSWYYVAGSGLVLGGLTYSGLDKVRAKKPGSVMKKSKDSNANMLFKGDRGRGHGEKQQIETCTV